MSSRVFQIIGHIMKRSTPSTQVGKSGHEFQNIFKRFAMNHTDTPGYIKNPLVWIDMEMTGLEVEKDKVLEVACLITDGMLNNITEGPNLILHQDEKTLENMNDWCINTHGKNGLTDACRKSDITEEMAEEQILYFLKEHVPEGVCPLAGNTVYMDRLFLSRYMPRVNSYLHYRIVDVSSVKELCRSWYPEEFAKAPPKAMLHRALDDIKASIEELRYYHSAIFKSE